MSPKTIEKSTAEEVVRACVSHLFSLLGERGKFVYAHKHMEPHRIVGGYNMLRHCGTVWFMCKAIRSLEIELTPSEQRLLGKALGYIGGKTKEPPWMGGLAPTLCMTSKDVVKLGGVGLTAVMIREYARMDAQIDTGLLTSLYPEGPEMHCIRLENYIVSQLSGGDFIHKRAFSSGDIYPFRSDYYTGQALFALMQSSRQILQIRTAMGQLLDNGYGLAEQSHWMAYAACASLKAGYCDEGRTVDYILRLIESIVSDPSYRDRHESTPIACRTEALVEILQTHRQTCLREHLPEAAVDAARTTAAENLALQLEYYEHGQFRKGRVSDKVQIDYIQHNGASLLGWWHLCK
ncbi:hypothetical protein AU195_11205 [Mycobacterium sp. IS-1496]|uniref:hypothetical protein n=1 Tax=Mycobacterium sp. IS-1496 TaxID=1772284 RepID=UPI0007415E08|nr:hypothetical protein [Mycobacterium sp. IS-1496]KUI35420.1 hypothetical protein AU195_11205 [Mycobacterium sp. IS-1496]